MTPSELEALAPKERREWLEGQFGGLRLAQLREHPVAGNFDASHVKEVNRRIFQDMPGHGYDDVTPGVYRPSVPEGKDWIKNRGLSTQMGSFCVAYSHMDEAAIARMEKTLEDAKPDKLRGLSTEEFTAKIAKIYTELDYAHPFKDGNSRTLRAFTGQLATESGFEIEWERFNANEAGRDLLYIARDRSVNALAKPHIQGELAKLKVLETEVRVSQCRPLPDLLRDVVRPSRAVAFERMTQRDALSAYPELQEAYDTMRAAGAYFEAKMPGKLEAHKAAMQAVQAQVQTRLNAGEIIGFGRGRTAQDKAARQQPAPAQERER